MFDANPNPDNNVSSNLNPDGSKKKDPNDPSTPSFTGGVGVGATGGAGTPGASGTVQSTSAPTSTQPASSGQFVNLSKYLDANKGAGQQIGDTLTNTANESTNKFGTDVSSGAAGVKAAVDADKARLGATAGFATGITNGVGSGGTAETYDAWKADPANLAAIKAADPMYGAGSVIGPDNTTISNGDPSAPKVDPLKSLYDTYAKGFTPSYSATDIANDPTKLAAFNAIKSGNTAAPTIGADALANQNNEQSSLNDITTNSNAANNETGRFQLLQQAMGRPSYTAGEQGLDQALLQSDSNGALNNLQKNMYNGASNAQKTFDTSNTATNKSLSDLKALGATDATTLKNAVGSTGSGVPTPPPVIPPAATPPPVVPPAIATLRMSPHSLDATTPAAPPTVPSATSTPAPAAATAAVYGTGALGKIYSDIQNKLSTTQGAAHDAYTGFLSRLNSHQLTTDDLQYLSGAMGGTALNGNTVLTGTPAELANAYSEQNYTLGNVMTPAQLAQYKALQTLSGDTSSNTIGGLDESQVGTANGPSIVTDPTKLSTVGQNNIDINSTLNPYRDLLDQATLRGNYLGTDIDKLNAAGGGKNLYDAMNAMVNDPNMANQPAVLAKLRDIMGSMKGNTGSIDEYGNLTPGVDTYDNLNSTSGDDAGWYDPSGNGKIDYKSLLGYNANQDVINKTQAYIDKTNTDKGATSIEDYMSPAAKAAFMAANPTTNYKDLMTGPASNLWNQQQYDATVGKFGFAPPVQTYGPNGPLANAISGLHNILGFSDENLKTNIKSGSPDVSKFLDSLKPYSYDYKNSAHGKGKHTSVMAQDLEKTPEGAQAIEEYPEGKAVNYAKLAGMMLASQADLHQRVKKIESNKK